MIKQLRVFSLAALAALFFAATATAQIHTIPVAPYDTIKSLPWADTKIAAKWDSIGYPNGWNAYSVDVDLGAIMQPGMLTFAVPSTWVQKEGGIAIGDTRKQKVQAMVLPLLKAPANVNNVELTFDFSTNELRTLYIAVLEGGENRFNTSAFINAMIGVFTAEPITIVGTEAPNVTKGKCVLDLSKYPTKELNIVILAADIDILPSAKPGEYGISNVKLVDADKPVGVVDAEQGPKPYAVGMDGGINVCNVKPGSIVEVYPLTGTTALRTVAASSVVNCSLQQGIYVVKVVDGETLHTFKVVVK